MGLTAGAFDKRVTLQSRQLTRSPVNGEESIEWGDVATVWANVKPLRGSSFFAARAVQTSVDHVITIRYRAGVTADMRVQWGDVLFDIDEVIDVNSRHDNLELMCVTGVRDGR